ncbi:proline-rich protein 2-like [Molossus molossus]|uniref:proline-rich protein 2-like n=1 Tax=Molossus molossus TaxID=27622 RepID=UPI0017474A46|nr:proline-rich protein 2-like [Molossus molossus]
MNPSRPPEFPRPGPGRKGRAVRPPRGRPGGGVTFPRRLRLRAASSAPGPRPRAAEPPRGRPPPALPPGSATRRPHRRTRACRWGRAARRELRGRRGTAVEAPRVRPARRLLVPSGSLTPGAGRGARTVPPPPAPPQPPASPGKATGLDSEPRPPPAPPAGARPPRSAPRPGPPPRRGRRRGPHQDAGPAAGRQRRQPGLLGSCAAALVTAAAAPRAFLSPFSNNKQEVRHAPAACRVHFRRRPPRMRPDRPGLPERSGRLGRAASAGPGGGSGDTGAPGPGSRCRPVVRGPRRVLGGRHARVAPPPRLQAHHAHLAGDRAEHAQLGPG